jgi:hypothetical protein
VTEAERIAKFFHQAYERRAPDHGYETRQESAVEWEDVPEANRGLMVAVAGELLERGVIVAGDGKPLGSDDAEWKRAYARIEGEDSLELVQAFHEQGMGWLANRVLHPFGWAIGLVVDDDDAVVGLGVQRTTDPEGIITSAQDELTARRRFLEAVGRPLPPEAVPEDGVLPTGCVVCGKPRYRKLADGLALPPVDDVLTFLVPHEFADGAVALACGNPRCPEFEPMQRAVP